MDDKRKTEKALVLTILLGTLVAAEMVLADSADSVSNAAVAGRANNEQKIFATGWSGGWNVRVHGRENREPEEWSAGEMQFRVYERLQPGLPELGDFFPALGIDVKARFERCADGNIQISSLDIGGLLYQQENFCLGRTWSRKVSARLFDQELRVIASTIHDRRGENQVRKNTGICEPDSWSCKTEERF